MDVLEKNFNGLALFNRGQLQDALTVMRVMERQGLTEEDVKEHIRDLVRRAQPRFGIVRRVPKEEREEAWKDVKWGPQPCISCEKKKKMHFFREQVTAA